MTTELQKMMVQDFEKYMRYLSQNRIPFTLETFVTFATSLVNFYSGSQLITPSERKDAALVLSGSFNAGIRNQITKEDLDQIAEMIISDPTLDYSILSPIFPS